MFFDEINLFNLVSTVRFGILNITLIYSNKTKCVVYLDILIKCTKEY